jgi:hypothetical protein
MLQEILDESICGGSVLLSRTFEENTRLIKIAQTDRMWWVRVSAVAGDMGIR